MDKFASMLFPLVEFSLYKDFFKAWQRLATIRETAMTFLQWEVEKEKRSTMAATGFTLTEEKENPKKGQERLDSSRHAPTATALLTYLSYIELLSAFFCQHDHAISWQQCHLLIF